MMCAATFPIYSFYFYLQLFFPLFCLARHYGKSFFLNESENELLLNFLLTALFSSFLFG